MMKNLALTASIIMLVAISGQAFARATGSNARYWPEAAGTPDQQAVRAYNAFAPAMAAPAVEPNTHRYEGGPKSND
jgi:hypothetical protein